MTFEKFENMAELKQILKTEAVELLLRIHEEPDTVKKSQEMEQLNILMKLIQTPIKQALICRCKKVGLCRSHSKIMLAEEKGFCVVAVV